MQIINATGRFQDDLIPNAVVGYKVRDGLTAIAAWRRYLGLSQTQVAERAAIGLPAYVRYEQSTRPGRDDREKIARALGIAPALLDL